MSILWFLLISFAFCYLFVASFITSPIRNYFLVRSPYIGKLLNCIQCFGFWSGFIFSLLSYFEIISINYGEMSFSKYPILNFTILGLLASLFSVLCNSLIFYFNSRDIYVIEKNNKDDESD